MVRRILGRIAAPIRGLHQAAYLLAALTLASQVLALVRDRTFAHVFGAGRTLDLYYAAFRMPDIVFALVSSLVSAYVIIPYITNLDREKTRELLSESATFLLGAGGAICVVLAIFMPQLLTFLYPDFAASAQYSSFILLARILLIQPILLGLSGVISSVTQVHRRFLLFAVSPVLYNLGIILGTVALYPIFGLSGIGIGVVLGAIGYLAVHIPVVVKAGVFPRFSLPTMKRMVPIVRNSVPRSLALSVNSFTLLALTAIASRLATGDISVFTLAGNLEAVPLALIGSSYSVAAFPALSEAGEKEDRAEFTGILSTAARHIIIWSLVALGLVAVLRAHIVRVILGSGAFGWDATRLTAALLAIAMVGLVVDALELLFSRALYAIRQSWWPLAYQLATAVLTIGLASLFLILPADRFAAPLAALLRVSDVPGTNILLLALANVVGQFFLVGLSIVVLRKTAPGLARALLLPARDGLAAGIAGGAVAYVVLSFMGGIAPLTTSLAVLSQGLAAGVAGLAAAAITLHLLGNEEFRTMVAAAERLWRERCGGANVLKPSGEDLL